MGWRCQCAATVILPLSVSMAMMNPGTVHGETTVTPSLTILERYDSNVYFIPGRNLDDFVTVTSPLVRVDHDDHLVKGNVSAGLTASTYVKNPGLNYVAASGGATLSLDQMLERVVRGLSLEVTDSFRFTPETPAFLTSETGNQVPSSSVIGIQAARADSFSNRGAAAANLVLSPTVGWQASYVHQLSRFGTSAATPPLGSFFNTTSQSVGTGPQWQVTPNDSVSLTYQYLKAVFSRSTGSGGFETSGGMIGWTRIVTPQLTASASIGLTVFPSGAIQHLGNGRLDWKSNQDAVHVQYSRSVVPSFFISGVPLVSDMVRATVTHKFTEQLSGSIMGSYAKNESVPAGILEFRSYTYGSHLSYDITSNISTTLSYSHSDFAQQFRSRSADFSRDQVMLSVHGEWK